jgi:hypothetical protein
MKRGIENLLYQLISSYFVWDIEAHWNLMLFLYRTKPGGFSICISTADFWLLRRIVRKISYFCLWGVKFRKAARLSMGDSRHCTACEVLPVLSILKESDMRQWYLIEFSLWYPTLSQVGSGPQNLPWLYQEIKSGKWSWTMPEILVLSSRIMMFSWILSAFQNLGPHDAVNAMPIRLRTFRRLGSTLKSHYFWCCGYLQFFARYETITRLVWVALDI